MMYSGKPPPLRSFSNGGAPGSKDASPGAVAALTQQQQRQGTSENCDPNHPTFSVGGKKEDALRKAESPFVLDDGHQSAGDENVEPLPPFKPDQEVALSECESTAAGNLETQSKEVNQPAAAAKSSLPSPTKVSVSSGAHKEHGHGHGDGHGRRPHFCRSPRCASNNPDYATPVQPTPRKYLVSKRHLLPGAICSKDPAVLAAQESAILLPQAPSTGKPPKPTRKLENVLRQPSFANAFDRNAAPLAYETSPTRIPKPPSSRSPLQLSSAVSPSGAPAAESHPIFSLTAASQEEPVLETSLGDEENANGRLAEPDVDGSEHLRSLSSDLSCAVVVQPISPRASDASGSSEVSVSDNSQLESSITFAGDDEPVSHLASLERPTTPICAEVPESLASEQVFPEPEGSVFAASSSPVLPSSAEVEDVTEELAQKLAFEDVEESSPPLTDWDRREEISEADVFEGRTESEEDSSPSGQFDAEGQLSKSDGDLRFAEESENGKAFQDEMNAADLGDCRSERNEFGEDCQEAKNADGGACYAERNEFGEDYQAEKNPDGGDYQAERHGFLVDCQAEKNADGGGYQTGRNEFVEDCQSEKNADGGDYQAERNEFVEDFQAEEISDGGACRDGMNGDEGDFHFRSDVQGFDNTPSSEETEAQEKPRGRSIASYIDELESARSTEHTERQCEAPKFVRGKGRQLWRSDCRDSREVVFLKQTPEVDRRDGNWMVDSLLEGAISKLNPSGQGRVRVLVEAFESLLHLGGDTKSSERRASRVWCLNRMEKGEVDEDGEEFDDGDQRVDCYEVSGDGLQLRASMRLSLGGGSRLPLYNPDDADEIEMSAIQKVQDWDDDCRQSTSLERLHSEPLRSQSRPDGAVAYDQENHSEGPSEDTQPTFGELQRRISFTESHRVLNENDRLSEDFSCDARTESQFGCYVSDDGQQRNDTRSTFSLNLDCKRKAFRRRRHWKANPVNLEPSGPSFGGGAGKQQRVIKGTNLEPFHLVTEERGMMKEYQFAKKVEQMFAEEEQLRNPIAQGLPWTTDEPEVVPKPAVKEQTRPVEFRHFSNSRAIERAEFDSYVSERSEYMEMRRQEEERLRQLAEDEDIKRLRREMVPRAQLMPFFDQPFIPTRSSKRLTVPKEPTFLNRQHKRAKCIVWQQQQQQQQQFPAQTYDRPHVFN